VVVARERICLEELMKTNRSGGILRSSRAVAGIAVLAIAADGCVAERGPEAARALGASESSWGYDNGPLGVGDTDGRCGGTLVARNVVLTAASCVDWLTRVSVTCPNATVRRERGPVESSRIVIANGFVRQADRSIDIVNGPDLALIVLSEPYTDTSF